MASVKFWLKILELSLIRDKERKDEIRIPRGIEYFTNLKYSRRFVSRVFVIPNKWGP